MCGIVGQVGAVPAPEVAEALIRRQLTLLRHRGPDGSGCIVDPHFAFGHARLAIIDPELGAQPFVSGDGSVPSGPAVSELFRPLRFVVPIGCTGGR